MKNQSIITIASILGMLAVTFGAFGAHYLKNKLSIESLQSFETGVRYQMYHAIVLLLLGLTLNFELKGIQITSYFFMLGIFFFSFSIYGLTLSPLFTSKWKFLGPVTPIGGLFLILGWLNLACQANQHTIFK